MAKAKEAPAAPPAEEQEAPKSGLALQNQSRNAVAQVEGMDTSMFRQDAAKGKLQVGKEDLAIPFIRVAQSNSPEIKKSEPDKFIQGLAEGDFFHTVTRQFWPGSEGIIVSPVSYSRSHIEFKTREQGGGIVKDWGTDSSQVALTQRDELGRAILPNGNQLVVSGLYYLILLDEPSASYQQVAMALASTQLKKARKWNTLIRSVRVSDSQGTYEPASFYGAYKITTTPEKNDKGSWMGVKIEQYKPLVLCAGGVEAYREASRYKELVEAGAVRANVAADAEYEVVKEDGPGEGDEDLPF